MKTETRNTIKNPVWVLCWTETDGIKETGRLIRRDLNWFPETIATLRGHACVWSRNFADVARGQEHAKTEGKTLLCLEDNSDVLNVARLIIETRDAPASEADAQNAIWRASRRGGWRK